MRHLFFLVGIPLLFDVGVATWLNTDGVRSAGTSQNEAMRAYTVFFDWDGVELSANSRSIVAAAVRDAALRGSTRIEVTGEVDRAAGPAYTAALAMERARRVRTELLQDGLPATAIRVVGAGTTARRIELVLQRTS